MLNLGIVRPGSTIRIPFSTFDKDDGSSITMTNYAAADVLIYKDGNTTERASANGITATTDFDSKTGKHLAIIDLSDNTTSGFYNAGSEYHVAIDAVTVDGVTTGGWIARFQIGHSEEWYSTTIATLSSQTSFTLTTGPAEDDALNGMYAIIHDIASAVQCAKVLISDYTGSTKTVTLAAGATFTAAAGDNISIMGMAPLQPTVLNRTLDVAATGEAGLDFNNILSTGLATLHSLTITNSFTISDGLIVARSSSNASAITATGNGTGHGAVFSSGSGATGDGVQMNSASTNGHGLTVDGNGTGAGLNCVAGATGNGIKSAGGSTSGDAILTSATSGHGATFAGTGTTKHGINATGGATTSDGIRATGGGAGSGINAQSGSGATGDGFRGTANSTNGNGVNVSGNGSGHGLAGTGGATGHGFYGFGGATSGDGIRGEAQTSGHGMNCLAVGTSRHGVNAQGGSVTSHGIRALGGGAGDGINATSGGGATGNGITATANATNGNGLSVTGNGSGSGMLATKGASGSDIDADINGTLSTLTTYTGNTPQTGDAFARLGAPVGASTSADIAGVQSDTNDIQTRLPAALVGGRMDSSVGAMAANVLTAAATAADFGTEIAAAAWNALTSGLSTVGSIGKLLVDNIDVAISSRLADADYTTPPTAAQNATELLDQADGTESGLTIRETMRLMLAALVGKLSGAATTNIKIRDTNDTKDRINATVDSDGNRSAVTLDAS